MESIAIDPQLSGVLNPPRMMTRVFKEDGTIPNNRKLPLMIYQGALKITPGQDIAGFIEQLLAGNHWSGSWRNGIYGYHHYHSTAHEVLAVFSGMATVQLGGNHGITQTLRAGDVVVIPAGVAHKNLGADAGFAVMGAYPDGQTWDLCYGNAAERPQADRNIAHVPLPEADPLYGTGGPLMAKWG